MGHFRTFPEIVQVLSAARRILVLTHNDPDGDALGSELLLSRGLRSIGKETRIINVGMLPSMYAFMLRPGEAEYYARGGPFPTDIEADLMVGVDFNDWGRLLGFSDVLAAKVISSMLIDHHPTQVPIADHTYIDTSASSTGTIVWDILLSLGVRPDASMAEPAYVSLITDTGHFRFSNTDPRAHRMASTFLELGVDPAQVNRHIFESSSLGRLRLMAKLITEMRVECRGKLAWIAVSKRDLEEHGLKSIDTEGYMDVLRTLGTLEVGLMFKEMENGQVRVSMRSKGSFDLNQFAQGFGGGGHPV
ncbi:MAG: bifunctional oligoribonuclease/PAP phosphatase NrnA, partial [Planctomycetota bacterium]